MIFEENTNKQTRKKGNKQTKPIKNKGNKNK